MFIQLRPERGERARSPPKDPTDAHPRETEAPGGRQRGFGDARGRMAVYLRGIARAARGRLFFAPFGGLTENTPKLKKLVFRKCFDPSCYGGAHATRRRRAFGNYATRQAPRDSFSPLIIFFNTFLVSRFQHRVPFSNFYTYATKTRFIESEAKAREERGGKTKTRPAPL